MKQSKPNARKLALDILNAIELDEAYSNLAIQEALRKHPMKIEDKRLVSRLVYGVLENRMKLDYCIQQYSKTKLKKIQRQVLNILRLAVYQIDFMERVPDSAAVNEAVKLTKKVNYKSSGFVNGILRAYLRGNGCLVDVSKMTFEEGLSILYSHPKWLIQRWVKQWGKETTETILKANNEAPDLTLRINPLKSTSEALRKVLEAEGVELEESALLKEAMLVKRLGKQSIEEMTTFKTGQFSVQDSSSMLVGHVVDPQPGQLVMDVCAAPGGKTTHLAELMQNQGQIIAFDIHPHKIDLIEANAKRLKLTNIAAECWDASQLHEAYFDKADKVLVDAPCSGLGIIRRKPEIRYTKTMDDIQNLSEIQLEILNTSAKYVKNHGQLIYSTCTIDMEENSRNIERFLEQHPNFKMDNLNDEIPEALRQETKYLQILPGDHGLDGFFIVRLTRVDD